jgi:hypothetical protein
MLASGLLAGRALPGVLGFGVLVSAIAVGQWSGSATAGDRRGGGDEGGVAGSSSGPDVVVGALPDVSKYGTVNGISAYALGTTSCNIGDEVLAWYDTGALANQHPVIAQNLYRIKDGRIEMIGMSWLKHGFCALSQTLCGPCQATNCDTLGIGCSDPYSSGLNGSQSGLGPKSQVNATTGGFTYPFQAPAAQATIGRRLQVPITDLDPAQNAGALYFGEGHYVTPDDAAAGNDDNNASYRRMTVGSFSSGAWSLAFTGPTVQQKPAIYAWQDHGLGVNTPDPDVQIDAIDVPDDGRFLVGYKAWQVGEDLWHYEYAIHNLNSDRSGQAFEVPIPAGVEVTNVEFHGVRHHSGEPYSSANWTWETVPGGIRWFTRTYAETENANALRWGTMFNFRFEANAPPQQVEATLTLFKPGDVPSMAIATLGPAANSIPGDLDGNGVIDGADLAALLSAWGTDDPEADLDHDGVVGGPDLAIVLGGWN